MREQQWPAHRDPAGRDDEARRRYLRVRGERHEREAGGGGGRTDRHTPTRPPPPGAPAEEETGSSRHQIARDGAAGADEQTRAQPDAQVEDAPEVQPPLDHRRGGEGEGQHDQPFPPQDGDRLAQ